MLGGDWLEQERSGYDVDRESTGDDFHATVRSQWRWQRYALYQVVCMYVCDKLKLGLQIVQESSRNG